MSWVRVWVHMVFSTHNNQPYLKKEIRARVFQHIKDNAKEKGIWLDCVSGYHDHAHCLVSLGKEQTISRVAQLIKGESSHWINQQHLIEGTFRWQDDYWAVSVSEGDVDRVRAYIHRQETHHSRSSFADEVKNFMKKYGWSFIEQPKQ